MISSIFHPLLPFYTKQHFSLAPFDPKELGTFQAFKIQIITIIHQKTWMKTYTLHFLFIHREDLINSQRITWVIQVYFRRIWWLGALKVAIWGCFILFFKRSNFDSLDCKNFVCEFEKKTLITFQNSAKYI